MKAKIKIDFGQVENMFDGVKKELGKGVKGARAGYLSGDKRKDGIDESVIALSNEFGVPSKNIPARPFMRNARDGLEKRLQKVVQSGLEREDDVEQILLQCGVLMKGAIVESIDSNIPPENAPATIKRKGSLHTLIDTGQLRQSVHSSIINNGKEKLLNG